MATSESSANGDDEPLFVAHNQHYPSCGRRPCLRTTDHPELYHGYFENRFCEQFVFTFDPVTKSGVISGGDLGWDNPKAFNLGLVNEVLRSTQKMAAQVVANGGENAANLPVIDAALALGRLAGLTGKDEIIWLRACLAACTS